VIREGDHVRVSSGAHGVVRTVNPGGLVVVKVHGLRPEVIEADSDVEILCSLRPEKEDGDGIESRPCDHVAVYFDRRTGDAVCTSCATWAYRRGELADARVDPECLVPCACGESLDAAVSHGIWTLDEVACEYRLCAHCGSSRAYMPRDVLPGRRAVRYDGDEIHDAEKEDASFSALLFDGAPKTKDATIIRNGVVLARAFVYPDGFRLGWRVEKPSREEPCRV
jgi:hypothetical protein